VQGHGIVFVKFPGPGKSCEMSGPRNLRARSWKVLEFAVQ